LNNLLKHLDMTLPPPTRARIGVAVFCLLQVLAFADIGVARADTPTPGGDSETLAIDTEIQKLKAESLALNRDASAVEEDFLFPAYTRISVDVSVGISGLLLHEIKVQVDANDPVTYVFHESESIALLQNKGLFRLMLANATPGEHQVHAEYVARYADASPSDRSLHGSLDGTFVKDEQTRSLEIVVGHGLSFHEPQMLMRTWSAPR
jgi:hypothetical protein